MFFPFSFRKVSSSQPTVTQADLEGLVQSCDNFIACINSGLVAELKSSRPQWDERRRASEEVVQFFGFLSDSVRVYNQHLESYRTTIEGLQNTLLSSRGKLTQSQVVAYYANLKSLRKAINASYFSFSALRRELLALIEVTGVFREPQGKERNERYDDIWGRAY